MSDHPVEPLEQLLAELREPVTADPVAKGRVMDAVRRAAPPPGHPGIARRGTRMAGARLTSVAGVALAAGVAGLITAGARASYGGGDAAPAVHVFGDTVAATLRDTLRLVRFMFVAPAAQRVALAGEFNRWNPSATPLHRPSPDEPWSVALRLPAGRHDYAFVVDDTQWVSDPRGTPASPSELAPPRSVIVVGTER